MSNVIIGQIRALDRMALMAWGVRSFSGSNSKVQFRVSCPKFKGVVEISLNGKDLYDISFIKVRKLVVKRETVNDVYAEDMVDIIDEKVG